MVTVRRGAVRRSQHRGRLGALGLQFRVSPRLATCLGATMYSTSSFVSLSTSTTSTPPMKLQPVGRRQLMTPSVTSEAVFTHSPSVNFILITSLKALREPLYLDEIIAIAGISRRRFIGRKKQRSHVSGQDCAEQPDVALGSIITLQTRVSRKLHGKYSSETQEPNLGPR